MNAWPPPQHAILSGDRLHLQHGPIDLIIKATGSTAAIRAAYIAAEQRFETVLLELTSELPKLRNPLAGSEPPRFHSAIANCMAEACWPYRAQFITPMAAVAGAVADAIKAAMLAAAPHIRTLYVNNGGDIALHAAPGEELRIGLVPDLIKAAPDGVATISGKSGVGGIATSGWRGRSFSRGIADAVTVLARTAAEADAAATIIANAVNMDHDAIKRRPAQELDPDSDLGDILVTTDVGPLPHCLATTALGTGALAAERLLAEGRILAAALALGGNWRLVESRTGLFGPLA
jgi:uncharacterized protein